MQQMSLGPVWMEAQYPQQHDSNLNLRDKSEGGGFADDGIGGEGRFSSFAIEARICRLESGLNQCNRLKRKGLEAEVGIEPKREAIIGFH